MESLHPIAATGFSNQAQAYANARPEYPEQAQSWLTDDLGVGPDSRVLEVGAGTGKFTAHLLALEAEVVAVEPVKAMREQLHLRFPNVTLFDAMADSLPFPDQSFDALVCAQSFHWFANAGVLSEFARVLRPGGSLGLIWNVRDDSVPWVKRLGDHLRQGEGELPRYSPELLPNVFPHPDFTSPKQRVAQHGQTGSVELVLRERLRSVSFIASMPTELQQAFLDRAQAVLEEDPELRGATTITFPYRTDMFSFRRR